MKKRGVTYNLFSIYKKTILTLCWTTCALCPLRALPGTKGITNSVNTGKKTMSTGGKNKSSIRKPCDETIFSEKQIKRSSQSLGKLFLCVKKNRSVIEVDWGRFWKETKFIPFSLAYVALSNYRTVFFSNSKEGYSKILGYSEEGTE